MGLGRGQSALRVRSQAGNCLGSTARGRRVRSSRRRRGRGRSVSRSAMSHRILHGDNVRKAVPRGHCYGARRGRQAEEGTSAPMQVRHGASGLRGRALRRRACRGCATHAVSCLFTFAGIGGGFLIVPGLLFATDMPMIAAVGSSLVAVTVFGITTAVNYAISDLVDWATAAQFIGGGILGGALGTRVALFDVATATSLRFGIRHLDHCGRGGYVAARGILTQVAAH